MKFIFFYLRAAVTALEASEMECLARSAGRVRRTAVWISAARMVDLLLARATEAAWVATLSNMSRTKELRILTDLEERVRPFLAFLLTRAMKVLKREKLLFLLVELDFLETF